MLRAVGGVAVLGIGGWMMMGGSGYSRTVDRPPAEVASALMDLDIREAPGAPGTDSMASGGSLPTFTVAATPEQVEWVVNAHGQVATRMIAHLKPVDGGKRTKVWAEVVRGPAPDDYVSPAFRSKSITMGLFSAVLEDELDELVFKIGPWGPHCDAVMARFEQRNMANIDQHDPHNLKQAVAGTSKAVMSIAALDKELKAAGCPRNANGNGGDGFVEPVAMMGGGPSAPMIDDGPGGPYASGSSPGEERRVAAEQQRDAARPMTDLSRYR